VEIPKSGIKVHEPSSLEHAAYLLRGGQDINPQMMDTIVEELLTLERVDSTAIFKRYYSDYKDKKEELAQLLKTYLKSLNVEEFNTV